MFMEVMNKKFIVSRHITEYCIAPYYDCDCNGEKSKEEYKLIKRTFAKYIMENISDEILGQFTEFFDYNDQNTKKLISLCNLLKANVSNEITKQMIDETIDSIENYKKLGLKEKNLFPLVDYYSNGVSCVAICLHIDSLNGILTRVVKINKKNKIIHDDEKQLSTALKETVEIFNDLEGSNFELEFSNSKQNIFIQCADYIGGNVLKRVNEMLTENRTRENYVLDRIIEENINFVSSYTEQMKVFPENIELKNHNYWSMEALK